MNEEPSLPEEERPRYLLPEGCSDLIDVLQRQQSQPTKQHLELSEGFDFGTFRFFLALHQLRRKLVPEVEVALQGQPYTEAQLGELRERIVGLIRSICERDQTAVPEEFIPSLALNVACDILHPELRP